ncbi:PDZ domain-containing protein [Pseudomonas viciae]|nr:PDZ domain-containing protein [Pseudomonas viciae]QBZ90918.1 PDZ domain-containing protein [Pseudomonas viciae]
MFATAFKSSTRLAVALSLTGLTGCASDGGLGEAAVIGAMFLPMPAGVDTSVMTTAVGVAAGAYVLSSVASADSASVSPATSTVAAPQGLPPIDLQKLVTRETPDRYRSKSCEYIEMSLSEVPMYQGSAEPILKQVGTARKEAASQVWLEKGCQLANLPRGKIGANIDTIDPQRAMALSFPPAGVVVLATVPGSGAQQAGLLPQDVIVAVDDRPIADSIDFRVAVAKASIGSRVNLKVWRANAFSIIPVVVGAGGTQV